MAQSISVLESDLYQNGRVFELENGDRVLFRERYEAGGSEWDAIKSIEQGQDIKLLAYNQYTKVDSRPEGWWWLIADRNAIYNPIFNLAVQGEGDSVDFSEELVIIPNLLKQKIKL